MFSANQDIEKTVEDTLDPARRSVVISQLESRLKWNKVSVNLSLVTLSCISIAYLIDRSDTRAQFLLLMFGLMTIFSFVAYISNFQRLVQLKVEERREGNAKPEVKMSA